MLVFLSVEKKSKIQVQLKKVTFLVLLCKDKEQDKDNGTGGQHRLYWPRSRARHGTAEEKVRIKGEHHHVIMMMTMKEMVMEEKEPKQRRENER